MHFAGLGSVLIVVGSKRNAVNNERECRETLEELMISRLRKVQNNCLGFIREDDGCIYMYGK